MESTLNSDRKTARLAGAIFFLVCWPASSWNDNVVSPRIFTPGDPTATATKLLENEFLFRSGIVTQLIGVFAFVFLALLLYRVFSPVDKLLARLMVIPPVLQVGIVFLLEVLNIAAMMTLKSDSLLSLDVAQRQEVAYFLMRMFRYGMAFGQLLWGLWMLSLGLLMYRTGYAPRIIGALTTMGGIGYVTEGFTYVLLQRPDFLALRSILGWIIMTGFASSMLWLVIKGVREPKPKAAAE